MKEVKKEKKKDVKLVPKFLVNFRTYSGKKKKKPVAELRSH